MSRRELKDMVYNTVLASLYGRDPNSLSDELLNNLIVTACKTVFSIRDLDLNTHPARLKPEAKEDFDLIYNYVLRKLKSNDDLIKEVSSPSLFKSEDLNNKSRMEDIINLAYHNYLVEINGYDPLDVDNILMEQTIVLVAYNVIDESEYVTDEDGRKVFTDSAEKAYRLIVDTLRERVFHKR